MEKATRSTNQKKKNINLLEAFENGDISTVLKLSKDIPDFAKLSIPDIVSDYYARRRTTTPVLQAIIYLNYHLCKLLIENGASLCKPEFSDERSPLSLALRFRRWQIAELLIESGADVNAVEFDNIYPMFWAFKNNAPPHIIEGIISAGFSLNSELRVARKIYSIHLAVFEGEIETVKLLLKHPLDINLPDEGGETAVSIAVRRNFCTILKLLLVHGGILINRCNEISPLVLAIMHNCVDMIKLLLDMDISIDEGWVGKEIVPPLHIAIESGKLDILMLLISKGADVNVKAPLTKETALHLLACCSKLKETDLQIKIAKVIIGKGAELNVKDNEGRTPLDVAVYGENTELCKLYIREGAEVADIGYIKNIPSNRFEYISCVSGFKCPELIRLCLERGCDYNYHDKNGLTPYHCVLAKYNPQMVKLFWIYGCPYNQPEQVPGKMESMLWCNPKDEDKKILEAQANFIEGIKQGSIDAILKSIKKGAEPKGCSMEIPSTLHYVSSKGHHDLARLLLEKGVPVNRLNSEGVTALYLAVQGGHLKTCQVLLEFGACYCHRGSVDNKGIELLVKSHQDISKVFKKISKCFKLTKLGDSSVLKVVLDCGEVMLPVLMNCVNRQGLTLTGLSLRLGHSGLATDLMALRVEHMTVKDLASF